ncbi:MAG: hypothetical protein ACRYGI_06925 [Janthinobacterium lividum]
MKFLRRILGFSPSRPPTRLTEPEALQIATGALTSSFVGQNLIVMKVYKKEDNVLWTLTTATVGSGLSITVNDATSEVMTVAPWGVR